MNGKFSFEDIPVFEMVSNGANSSFRPIYYTIKVTNAQSDEIDVNVFIEGDPSSIVINPLYFTKGSENNIRSDAADPITQNDIVLSPLDGISTKMDLAANLSGTATVNNYKPIEDRVVSFLNDLIDNPTNQTGNVLEGLNRAIWAERVVLDSSIFADQLITLSLAGFGAFIADVYDEVVGHFSKGKSVVEKDIKRIEQQSANLNNSAWKLDPDFGKVKVKTHLDGLKRRKDDADFIDDVLINGLKAFLVELQTFLELSGVEADTAESIKGITEKSLVLVLKSLKSAAINEFTKGDALKGGLLKSAKFVIPEVVNLAKPVMLDNATLPSYTKLTAPFLENAVDKFIGNPDKGIEPWGKADPKQYKIDR